MSKKPSFYKQQNVKRGKKLHRLRVDRQGRSKQYALGGHLGFGTSNIEKGSSTKKLFKPLDVVLPAKFSTEHNLENVVKFFKPFSRYKYDGIKSINFDMSRVVDIDICAIVMFLTKIEYLSKNGIYCMGNMPTDKDCERKFKESGFLQHMNNISGGKFSSSNDYNLIVKRGGAETESKLTGKTIKKVVQKLTGSSRHYKPVQSIVQEMAGNAIEHAYERNKHWLFCVNCTETEAIFILSDAGSGIISTLNRKYRKIIESLLIDNLEVLKRAFEKKYGSSTDEVNRNKGLPMIKKNIIEKKVLNLRVLTNNVYLDFDNDNNSTVIGERYSGTVYIWKINKEVLENAYN